jgi:hypothetical protein
MNQTRNDDTAITTTTTTSTITTRHNSSVAASVTSSSSSSSPPPLTTTTQSSLMLSEQTVLAPKFVPHALRQVNEWIVTTRFLANSNSINMVKGPKGLLVPFVPICHCLGVPRFSTNKPLHCFPLVDETSATMQDLYHAVRAPAYETTIPKTANTESTTTTTTTATNGTTRPTTAHNAQPNSPRIRSPLLQTVDDIGHLDDYVSTWKHLLQLERWELLVRFERYSQYSRPIQVRPVGNTKAELVASLSIPGIADASPPVLIGDVVLVRPIHLVSLPVSAPLPHPQHQPIAWSAPIHVVEIQATVQSVHRSSGKAPDRIHTSWMVPSEWTMLEHSLLMKNRPPHPNIRGLVRPYVPPPVFNIRFVPAATVFERCRVALQWLAEAYRDNPQAAMAWLFPNAAPMVSNTMDTLAMLARVSLNSTAQADPQQAPLNEQQASFVRMVLARTQQASGQIRPPMVLTGPAGTGTCTPCARSRVWAGPRSTHIFPISHADTFALCSV